MSDREIRTLLIDGIMVLPGRELNSQVVSDIASSIELVGLQNPISVVDDGDNKYRIISGRHRLAAVRSLGRVEIEAIVYRGLSDVEIRLAEIVENLHRAELSQLERSEQIADYTRLAKEKRQRVSGQVVQKPKGGRPEGGDSAAARALGLNRKEVERAGKIAGIDPEAKKAAKQAGLDDNQRALLKVAAAPKEKQAETAAKIAAAKAAGKISKKAESLLRHDVRTTVQAILRDFSASEVQSIIDALSESVAVHGAGIKSSKAIVAVSDSVRGSYRGDDDTAAPSTEVIEEIEEIEVEEIEEITYDNDYIEEVTLDVDESFEGAASDAN